jgi:SnoaL-like domain
LTHEDVAGWLDRYVEAWLSYDRGQIGDLFSEDAVCRYYPYGEPVVGRDAVIDSWLAEGEYTDWDRDEPGTYEASYRPVAVESDVAVAVGTSGYRDQPGGEIKRVYHNCFVMRFDGDGRCAEFTEWFMQEPEKPDA